MKDKVLIVEDKLDIAKLIQVHLSELDLQGDICTQGEEGLQKALSGDYQLILLDVMLPEISGLDICRQVRQERPLQAIIMLTAKSSEIDRVLGLELGADDYMAKPFSIRELQARVRSQLRRVHALAAKHAIAAQTPQRTEQLQTTALQTVEKSQENTQVQLIANEKKGVNIGLLYVDHRYHQVTYQDRAINLTATEFELIDFFCQNPDQVFSRAQLLDGVWGYHHSGYEHTVNSHINRLRNKLEQDCTDPQIIQTVWGVGYKLNSAGVMAEAV